MTMSWHLHFTYTGIDIGDGCTGACSDFAIKFIERFKGIMNSDPYEGCGVYPNYNNPPTEEWCKENQGNSQCDGLVGQELPYICALISPDSNATGVNRFQSF